MKKRVDGNGIAMLIDLDDCLGCFGCEAACRETHRYPYDEDWMKLIRREPWLVDGKAASVPRSRTGSRQVRNLLKHRAATPCACQAAPPFALKVGPFEDIVKESEGRHCVIYRA